MSATDSEADLALLRLIASGQCAVTHERVLGLVVRGLAEIKAKRGSGGKTVDAVFLTMDGLAKIRAARGAGEPRAGMVRPAIFGKGRNVLYVPAPLKERAAIIVDTHKDGTANLIVFGTGHEDTRIGGIGDGLLGSQLMRFVANAPHCADVRVPGTWHWLSEGHTRMLPGSPDKPAGEPVSEA